MSARHRKKGIVVYIDTYWHQKEEMQLYYRHAYQLPSEGGNTTLHITTNRKRGGGNTGLYRQQTALREKGNTGYHWRHLTPEGGNTCFCWQRPAPREAGLDRLPYRQLLHCNKDFLRCCLQNSANRITVSGAILTTELLSVPRRVLITTGTLYQAAECFDESQPHITIKTAAYLMFDYDGRKLISRL